MSALTDKTNLIAISPVSAILDKAAAANPLGHAMDFLGHKTSYAQLARLANRAARGFQQLGVKKGTRAGLCLPNSPHFIICYYAILKAGGIVVNFNPLYVERELKHQIDDSGTTFMVTVDQPEILTKVQDMLEVTSLKKIVVCPMSGVLPFDPSATTEAQEKGQSDNNRQITFETLISGDGAFTPVEIDAATDIAVLQYTGGTTGVPKGAMLTHGNLSANTQQLVEWFPDVVHCQERMLLVLPLFHVFAMTVGMNLGIALRAELILLPRFDVGQIMECIAEKRPTMFPGVPTIYTAINAAAETAGWDLSSIRYCISGGAPLPAEVRSRFEKLTGCRLVEGYGLSEASPVATCNPFHGKVKAGSVGLPLPGTTIEVRSPVDPAILMEQGEKGEICIYGPQVMAGYWQRPGDTDAVMHEGALRTGDIGYMDEDGFVFLVDRIKDLIISGGYNVYPRVIEEALYQHPAVAEVIVIGIPDPYRGQVGKAFVRLKDGQQVNLDQLKEFLADYLSPIEMPKLIEIRAQLPKTTVGKLSKKELIEEEMNKEQGGNA